MAFSFFRGSFDALVEKILRPCIDDWRAKRIHARDGFIKAIRDRSVSWEATEEAREIARKATAKFQKTFNEKINQDVVPICTKYGIQPSQLNFEIDFSLIRLSEICSEMLSDWWLAWIDKKLGLAFDNVVSRNIPDPLINGFLRLVRLSLRTSTTFFRIVVFFDGDAQISNVRDLTRLTLEAVREQLAEQQQRLVDPILVYIR